MNSASTTRPTGLKDVRALIKDLMTPRPEIYWPDMLISAGLGWGGFVGAVRATPGSIAFVGWTILAILALYRAVLFIHELTHLSKGALPGFEFSWNVLVGIPMLVPSFTYVGVHTDHHRRTVYGTPKDPEYLPLGCGSRWLILWFVLETAFVPLMFVLRFVVATPIGLLIPRLHRWLERHASSLVINLLYVRKECSPSERLRMRLTEGASCSLWLGALALAWQGVIPWQTFLVWYLVSFGVALVNQVRTLGAHRYRNPEAEMDVVGQLLDSVSIPGAFWTELWAPVGLRYHALHHYVPDLPYHGLGAAHRRLIERLPQESPYRDAVASSLPRVISELWSHAGGRDGLRDQDSRG